MQILHTEDYLTFEALLNLFVRLLPVKKITSGPKTSAQFIREVFVTSLPTHTEVGHEIERTLTSISSNEWEVTVMKVAKVLSQSRSTL